MTLSGDGLRERALALMDLVLRSCRLHKDSDRDSAYTLEVLRTVALNAVISVCTGQPLVKVTSDPDLGIMETSPASGGAPVARIRSAVQRAARVTDEQEVHRLVGDLPGMASIRLLEVIHSLAAYDGVYVDGDSVEVTGPSVRRKGYGAFYTPPAVAESICEGTLGTALDEALESVGAPARAREVATWLSDLTVLDPACGPGVFLIEAARCLLDRAPLVRDTLVDHLNASGCDRRLVRLFHDPGAFRALTLRSLYGVDLDAAAAEIASVCLSLVTGTDSRSLKLPFLDTVKVGDSLVSELPVGACSPSRDEVRRLLDYRRRVRSAAHWTGRRALDHEYAALVRDIEASVPCDFGDRRASVLLPPALLEHAFSWELEFPEVFFREATYGYQRAGFDFVVMNPPYDILKLNRSEFMRLHRGQSGGVTGPDEEFEALKARERLLVRFFRQSGHYRLSVDSVLNLYRLMIERALQVTSERARLAFIVPSTFLCDYSARRLRAGVLERYTVLGVDDFVESARVFEGVSQAVCIVRIDKTRPGSVVPVAVHDSWRPQVSRTDYTRVPLPVVRSVSGSSLAVPRAPSEAWRVLKKLHRWPTIGSIPWLRNRRGELDLTAHREFISREPTDTPLIRGSHIRRYRVEWSEDGRGCYVNRGAFESVLGGSSKLDHIRGPRLVSQQVSNMSQVWRLKAALVGPGPVLANSCNYISVASGRDPTRHLLFLMALFNSHLVNWRFRVTSSNNHVSNREVAQLPVPPLDTLEGPAEELAARLVECVQALSSGTDDGLEPMSQALVFQLYGLDVGEARFVMSQQGAPRDEVAAALDHMAALWGMPSS